MNKQLLAFGGMIGMLILIFSSMIMYQEQVLNTGERVILKTVPVDPRDIFRGDYVILRYDIQNQVDEMMVSDFYIDGNRMAYVSLDTNQSPAVASGVSMDQPSQGLYLKGQVQYGWDGRQEILFPDLAQYYVPEGQGRPLERIRGEDLTVEISVTKNGTARILNLRDKGIVIDVNQLGKSEPQN